MYIFVGILLCTLSTHAQYVEIHCNNYNEISANAFSIECMNYTIKSSDTREIVFIGNEPKNVTFDDVIEIRLNHPSVPFFVNETFATFPNLQNFIIFGSLIVMHPYAFSGAEYLEALTIMSESLQVLPANAFTGATKLLGLGLLGCTAVIQVDEAAFVGLDNLLSLEIWSTSLGPSPTDIFKPLVNLESISLIEINVKEIRSELFANNLKLELIQIVDPNIKAAERTFIDALGNLKFVTIDTHCAEATFVSTSVSSNSSATLSQFHSAMEPCYLNYTLVE